MIFLKYCNNFNMPEKYYTASGDKVTDIANSTVVCCLYSKLMKLLTLSEMLVKVKM